MTNPLIPSHTLDMADSALRLSYRMTSTDLWKAAMQSVSISVGSTAFGSFLVAIAVFPILMGDLFSIVTLLAGLAVFSGVYCIPIALWAARRRADLLLSEQDLAIDDWGIRFSTSVASSQQAWPTFRRVRELTDAFLLDYGTGAAAVVPKHAFDGASMKRFLELASGAGKLDRSPAWQARGKGIAIGVSAAVGLTLILVVANARV